MERVSVDVDRWTNCEFYEIGTLNFNGCMYGLFYSFVFIILMNWESNSYIEKKRESGLRFFSISLKIKIIFLGKMRYDFFVRCPVFVKIEFENSSTRV